MLDRQPPCFEINLLFVGQVRSQERIRNNFPMVTRRVSKELSDNSVPRGRVLMLRLFSPEGGIASAVAVMPRFRLEFMA